MLSENQARSSPLHTIIECRRPILYKCYDPTGHMWHLSHLCPKLRIPVSPNLRHRAFKQAKLSRAQVCLVRLPDPHSTVRDTLDIQVNVLSITSFSRPLMRFRP